MGRPAWVLKLNQESATQTAIHSVNLLWASAKLDGLLSSAQQESILDEIFGKQRPDGGWSLSSLEGSWQRYDGSPEVAEGDGYATGLIVLTLEEIAIPREIFTSSRGLFGWPGTRADGKVNGRPSH